MIMGRDAQPDPGVADRAHISVVEVLLPQMDEIGALIDGDLPVIIHDQLALVLLAERDGVDDLGADLRLRQVLDAKLNQPKALGQQAMQPRAAVEDRIEPVELHSRNAFPMTGVEGLAMSRGSIRSALKAAAPASIACANARAIATGSPALATAVFRSTAS